MKVTLTVVRGPHEGRTFTFTEHDTFLVGRAGYAHFQLPKKDQHFSRAHFMVEVNPPFCRLIDMASTNGTFVNKVNVHETDLAHNDLISGGDTVIRVRIEGADKRRTRRAVETPGNLAEGTAGEPSSGETGTSPEQAAPPTPAATDRETGLPEDDSTVEEGSHTPLGRLADYDLLGELGRGGMGIVYEAVRRQDGEAIALKTVKPGAAVNRREVDRFLREVSIHRDLQHPGIVGFYESGTAAGRFYFAMELVRGRNASQLLAETGPLPAGRAVSGICQLLEALDYAHKRGFVHRDIKPSNLLLSSENGEERLKLADFGLARAYQCSRVSGLTLQGETGGSVPFMPPEQITNYRDTKPAGDLYAAAATLYMLLTGSYVYEFPNTFHQRILKILQEEPIPITDRRADVPAALAEVIHRGLARKPADRFPDAGAMRDALQPFARQAG